MRTMVRTAEEIFAEMAVTEVLPTVEPPAKLLKVSQLIREGSRHTKQTFCIMADGEGNVCALGALKYAAWRRLHPEVSEMRALRLLKSQVALARWEEVGQLVNIGWSDAIDEYSIPWPEGYNLPQHWMSYYEVEAESGPTVRLTRLIYLLNDEWRWSREQIADFIERLGY